MKTLIVSGVSARTRSIISNLEKLGLEIEEWTFSKGQTAVDHVIPKSTELVLVLTDFISHPIAEHLQVQCSKREVKFLRVPHRWSFIYQELFNRGIINTGERIEMGAGPDKTPEALVIGGDLQDRAEIYGRMSGFGWKVKDHWLTDEGGHEYNKPRNGIKLIVVLRDRLENKQYQQAHTLAQLSHVPVIKWDVNRELFRKRLQLQNLLYESLENVHKAPEPVIEQIANETVQEVVEMAAEVIQNGSSAIQVSAQRTATEELRAVAELVHQELLLNTLYNGLTVRLLDDGSAEMIPIARTYQLGTAAPRAVETLQPVGHGTNPPQAKPNPISPEVPPKRPVVQPIVPKIEPLGLKTKKVEPEKTDPLGRRIGRRGTPDMTCRFPECKARSKGPRYGFFCEAHVGLPAKKKEDLRAQYKVLHSNK